MKIFFKIIWCLFILSFLFHSLYLSLNKRYDEANNELIMFFILSYMENEKIKSRKLKKEKEEKEIAKEIKNGFLY